MTDIYVGKVLVQYYLIISYNRLRNTPNVPKRHPPSSRRTFVNGSRPGRVKRTHFRRITSTQTLGLGGGAHYRGVRVETGKAAMKGRVVNIVCEGPLKQ